MNLNHFVEIHFRCICSPRLLLSLVIGRGKAVTIPLNAKEDPNVQGCGCADDQLTDLTQSSQWPSLIGSWVPIQKSVLSIWTWLNSLKCSRATNSLVFLCSGRWAVLMESPKMTFACTAWPNQKHVINQIPYCHCPSYPMKGLNNQLSSAWWHFTLWHSIKPRRFTSIRRVN